MPTRPSPSCGACVESSRRAPEPLGATLYSAGSHALARGAGQPLVPLERYRQLAKLLGDGDLPPARLRAARPRRPCPTAETCLRAFEGVVPWLPTLLALSANSPFAEGEDTGRRSERAERLLDMPTGGTPPVLRSWDDWETATAGDDDAPPLGRLAAARVRDARGARDGHADRRPPVGRVRGDRRRARRRGRGERARDLRPRPLRAAARRGRRARRRIRPRSRRWRRSSTSGRSAPRCCSGRPEAERQLELPHRRGPGGRRRRTLAF